MDGLRAYNKIISQYNPSRCFGIFVRDIKVLTAVTGCSVIILEKCNGVFTAKH